MAWYNLNKKNRGGKKQGGINFPAMFQQIFLQRTGIVNSYDDDARSYIEEGYQKNPVVYAIVNMISKNVGKARWCVKNADNEEITVPLLSDLLIKPNPLQSWTDLQQDLVTHKILEGNLFVTGEYGSGINSGKYTSLYSLPSEDMQIIASRDFKGIQGYRVDFSWSENTTIPATDVLHLRNPNPDFDESDNWLFGQSNFRAARDSIMTHNESLNTGVYFLKNKGAQKAVFPKDPDVDITPKDLIKFKEKIRKQGQGARNSANLMLLDIELGAIDLDSDPKKALVLEQRKQAALEICNVVNFPPQLIGLEIGNYRNTEEAKLALWENCIIPELHELKEGYNRWLAGMFGEGIYLDYDLSHIDALQEGKLTRGKAITSFAGMITVNEARALAGMSPIEGPEGEAMYVAFTQAVTRDGDKPMEDGGNNTEPSGREEPEKED